MQSNIYYLSTQQQQTAKKEIQQNIAPRLKLTAVTEFPILTNKRTQNEDDFLHFIKL